MWPSHPKDLPGASFRIGYYGISYHYRIEYPTINTADPLSDQNILPFVIRNPGHGAILRILQQSQFVNLTGRQYSAQEATLVIDDRNQNITRQKASGFDLLLKYDGDTPLGTLAASVNVAYLNLEQQITNQAVVAPLSGTVFYPPTWPRRFGVSWSDGDYLGSLFLNYTGGSREVAASEPRPSFAQISIASWTTLDGQTGMNFHSAGHRGNTRVTLSAQNLLDRHPPLLNLEQPGMTGIN